MKRKILALLVVIMLVTTVFAPSLASACSYQSNKNYQLACIYVNSANVQIYSLVLTAQLTPYNDVPWLLRMTKNIADSTTQKVRRLGYDVRCEYIAYRIDGQIVLIDPLHVVNPLPNSVPD